LREHLVVVVVLLLAQEVLALLAVTREETLLVITVEVEVVQGPLVQMVPVQRVEMEVMVRRVQSAVLL
jgi:hypothetical protein